MPKFWFLAVITVLGCTPSGAVPAEELPPIRRVVSFGDSLSDAGTYWFRFTTNPGLTFAQHLALHYGQMPFPNQHLDRYEDAFQGQPGDSGPGGLNYAEGGAKVDSAYSTTSQNPEGKPISARQQLNHFLKQHHRFEADQLVTLFVGTNDVAYHYDPNIAPALAKELREDRAPSSEQMNAEIRRVEAAADATAAIARDIVKAGAQRLVVFNLFDLGQFPWFQTPAAQTYVTTLVQAFNRRLATSVPKDSAHVLLLDTERFVDNLIANAAHYGFKHGAREDACGSPDHDYCYPETQATADADESYLFAAGEHLTTHSHRLLADWVLEQVNLSPLK
jgi:outer membrane lipase/esterase